MSRPLRMQRLLSPIPDPERPFPTRSSIHYQISLYQRKPFSEQADPDTQRRFRLMTEQELPKPTTFFPDHNGKCHVTKLSLDHFTIVASFLETQDIQSARLAGRVLHNYLSPYLFKAVRFAPHIKAIDVFDKISKDSVLSHNVHELRFDTSLYRLPIEPGGPKIYSESELQGLEAYHRRFTTRLPPQSPGYWLALAKYIRCVEEQDTIIAKLEGYLVRLLDMFPKISTISLSQSFRLDQQDLPEEFKLASPSDNGFVQPFQLRALFRAIFRSKSHITSLRHDTGSWWLDVRPANASGVSYVWHWMEKKPVVLSSAFELSPEDLLITKSIFRNLTRLDLTLFSLVNRKWLPSPTLKPYWADLPKALHALTSLTALSLDLTDLHYWHSEEDKPQDDIVELFESPPLTLPRLRTLRLAHFRISTTGLSSLLRRHPTIQGLTLRHLISTDWDNPNEPGWIELVEDMRSMRLRRLHLYGIKAFGIAVNCYGDKSYMQSFSRFMDYILHGYGNNPILRDNEAWREWDEELWG